MRAAVLETRLTFSLKQFGVIPCLSLKMKIMAIGMNDDLQI